MIVENLLPFLLLCAIVFGLLWLVIEAGAKLVEVISNRE